MSPKAAQKSNRVDDDRHRKWERGRQEHGPVMHEDPLCGLYSECLDAMNYVEALKSESHLQDACELLDLISITMRRAAKTVLFIQNEHPDRQYQPQEHPFR